MKRTDQTTNAPIDLSEKRRAAEGGRIPPRLAAIAAEAMRKGFAARPDDDDPPDAA